VACKPLLALRIPRCTGFGLTSTCSASRLPPKSSAQCRWTTMGGRDGAATARPAPPPGLTPPLSAGAKLDGVVLIGRRMHLSFAQRRLEAATDPRTHNPCVD